MKGDLEKYLIRDIMERWMLEKNHDYKNRGFDPARFIDVFLEKIKEVKE